MLVCDNNTHTSAAMRRLAAARQWLTVCQFRPHAPEFNPVEAVWSHLKRSLAHLVKCGIDRLAALVRSRLRHIQHRPGLLDGFITKTGLNFTPVTPVLKPLYTSFRYGRRLARCARRLRGNDIYDGPASLCPCAAEPPN
ncbi:transposase [Pseudarthrobacter sp. P1]|uniref:transposase n=1 Tax=Pseudarthrobacter sp. P1 TaxID=3418418 RepID=UPI003CE7A85F